MMLRCGEGFMATLKVGEIVIDDGRVSFDGQSARPPAPPEVSPLPPQTSHRSLSDAVGGVPGRPRTLIAASGLLVVVAAMALASSLLSSSSLMSLAALVLAVPVMFAAIGLFAVGLAKRALVRGPKEVSDSSEQELLSARLKKLEPLLGSRRDDLTFEVLRQESGFTESALLATLQKAETIGLVKEELNLETGEYYYRINPRTAPEDERPRTLDERAAALAKRATKRTDR